MDCLELRKNLFLYIDNELSPKETRVFREHLEACDPCRRRAAYEERFQDMLRDRLAPSPAPSGLRERILELLSREASREKIERQWWRSVSTRSHRSAIAAGFAALLALLVAAPFLTNLFISRESGVPAHLEGHLVCIPCEKAGVTLASQKNCRTFGHETGLKTEDGRLFYLAKTERAEPLLSDISLRGTRVKVEGILYPRIATIDVHRHTPI